MKSLLILTLLAKCGPSVVNPGTQLRQQSFTFINLTNTDGATRITVVDRVFTDLNAGLNCQAVVLVHTPPAMPISLVPETTIKTYCHTDLANASPLGCLTAEAKIYLADSLTENLFERALMHELGHAFGLRHSDDSDSLMYPILNSQLDADGWVEQKKKFFKTLRDNKLSPC